MMAVKNSYSWAQLVNDLGTPWFAWPALFGYPLSCKSLIQFCSS